MKKKKIIILIAVILTASTLSALAFLAFGGILFRYINDKFYIFEYVCYLDNDLALILEPLYPNVTKMDYGDITVEFKEGYDYDLGRRKYDLCPFCSCCEEGMCDWHCEAAYDLGLECGCSDESPSLFDYAVFTFPDTPDVDEIDNSSKHFYSEDIFPVYVHIAKRLTDKDSITDDEVIELASYYKKLTASIEEYTLSNADFIDTIPDMPELYGDMRGDISALLNERGLVLNISNVDEELTTYLSYECLVSTGAAPLDKIYVVCHEENVTDLGGEYTYYAFSEQGYCYFSIYISYDGNYWSSCFSYSPSFTGQYSQKDVAEMQKMAVSITDTDSEIPVFKKS